VSSARSMCHWGRE